MGFKAIKFEIGTVPHDLLIQLKETYKIKNFVETGTYLGETTEWASKHFENVITFEAAENIYYKTKERLKNIKNIEFIFGQSDKELHTITIHESAIFWLDAHYSAGDTFKGEPPLIKELEIINTLDINSFIFIDDARFVVGKWQNEHYCDLSTLIQVLCIKKRYVAIIDDVIIGVPYIAKELVNKYSNKVSEKNWNNFLAEINKPVKKNIIGSFKSLLSKLKN